MNQIYKNIFIKKTLGKRRYNLQELYGYSLKNM